MTIREQAEELSRSKDAELVRPKGGPESVPPRKPDDDGMDGLQRDPNKSRGRG